MSAALALAINVVFGLPTTLLGFGIAGALAVGLFAIR